MRCTYVPLSFVLCAVAIVGCWPLHPLEPSTDELSVPVSPFQSKLIMGGFLSRARRREDKEETSPRLKSEAEAKPDQNEIEVNWHKKQIAESSSDEITVGVDPIEECESPECVDLVRSPSDEMPADEIFLEIDADPVPELHGHPASEEEVVDVVIEEQDNNRDMRSSPHHHDEIQESSHNDDENVVNVDVSEEQPHPDPTLHQEDETQTDLLSKYPKQIVEEPDYERDVRSPSIIPFTFISICLRDPDVIVDVISEESRPVFDPSIHLMAEPVIFHPQPLPVEDVIELDLDIDDELMKRKKRTLQNPNDIHPELKDSQPGLDDE